MKKSEERRIRLEELSEEIAELPYSERIILRSAVTAKLDYNKRTRFERFFKRADFLVDTIKDVSGHNVKIRTRAGVIPILRAMVITTLQDEGWKQVEIARYFNMSYSTMNNCTYMVNSMKAYPKQYPYEWNVYQEYLKRI